MMFGNDLRVSLGRLAFFSWAALLVVCGCDVQPDNEACNTNTAQQAAGAGKCVGTATSCSSLSAINCVQEGCDVDIGVYDDPYDDDCEGRADPCDEMDSETLCHWQKGCTWETDGGDGEQPTASADCDDDDGGGGVPGSGAGGTSDPGSGAGGSGVPGAGAGGMVTPGSGGSNPSSGTGGTGGASNPGAGGSSNPGPGAGGTGGGSTPGPGAGGTGGGAPPPMP